MFHKFHSLITEKSPSLARSKDHLTTFLVKMVIFCVEMAQEMKNFYMFIFHHLVISLEVSLREMTRDVVPKCLSMKIKQKT